jgi:biopolymer transport protein ExbD
MKSDINVTPLVDVCLVLLIIFMVVTFEMARGKELPLPRATNHILLPDRDGDVVVSVMRDGGRLQIFWDEQRIGDVAELARRQRQRPGPAARTFVKADAALPFSDVAPVLAALHRGGADGVQLATRGE